MDSGTFQGEARCDTGASERNTPPEKKTPERTTFQDTKSGGEEQLLQDGRANARVKEVFLFTETGMSTGMRTSAHISYIYIERER